MTRTKAADLISEMNVGDATHVSTSPYGLFLDGKPYALRPEPFDEVVDRRLEHLLQEVMRLLVIEDEEQLEETPRRVRQLLQHFCQPTNLRGVLGKQFPAKSGAMVVQSGIPFEGLCAHHWQGFKGVAHVGYIPGEHVVGVSKLTRVVQCAGTQRPSLQEWITDEVADAIDGAVKPKGVIVVSSAVHGCMSVRGPRTGHGTVTGSSSVRGLFLTVPAARQEFFDIVKLQQSGGGFR